MKIELSTPTLLKITWQPLDPDTEAEILRRLKTVPGIEGAGHRWYAPVIQLARLMDLFPRAGFDYRAMQTADMLARRFYESLVMMRVEFSLDEFDDPMAIGDNVSPLLQQLIHDRRHALKCFLVNSPARVPARQPERPSIAHLYPNPRPTKRKRARKVKAK